MDPPLPNPSIEFNEASPKPSLVTSLPSVNAYAKRKSQGTKSTLKPTSRRPSILKSARDVADNLMKSSIRFLEVDADSTHSLIQDEKTLELLRKSQYRWTLSFTDTEAEMKYQRFIVHKSEWFWKATIALILVFYLAFYVFTLVLYPRQAQIWRDGYRVKVIDPSVMAANMVENCPVGYYCSECPFNGLCGEYQMGVDIASLLLVWISGLTAIALSKYMKKELFFNWFTQISVGFLFICSIFSIIIRFYLVENNANNLLSGLLLILLIHCGFSGLRVRWAATTLSLFVIDIFWLACRIAADNQYTHQLAESIIVGFALFASNLIIVFNAFRYEVFYRQQFLRTRMQYRNTRRLTHQLKVLSENHAIPSSGLQFETPLEQAMRMIRLLIADSNASSDQILKLDTVLQLLNSPQLLTSDVERQLSVAASSSNDERSLLDDDQKSYLISTISNSGRKALDVPKSSASSFMVRRKRRNSTATYMTSLMNIGENAIIPPVPSLPRALSSVDSSQDAESVQTQRRDVPDAIRALSLSSRKITAGAEPPEIQEETSVSKPNPFNFAMAQLFQLRFEPDVQLVPGFSKVSKIPRPSSMLKSSEDTNPVRAIELLDTIYDWNWPLFEFAECCPGEKPLYILAWHLFDDSGLFEAFDIPSDKFNNFMWRIQEGYRELPYHNATHAADVLHAVNYFSQLEGVKDIIERRPLDLLAIYIAAAIHDYDHPGLNNNYLINTKNPLAILYNDLSVLESYHVSSAFQILLKPECNFMVNFSKADWQYIRELVIEMVLATDLLQHTKAVAQFRTMAQNFNTGTKTREEFFEVKENRFTLYKMFIKCADVSNPAKEFSFYMRCANNVVEEWRNQGDSEKSLGLPVLSYMDRKNSNVMPPTQSGFIKGIVRPLFQALHRPPPIEEELYPLPRDSWGFCSLSLQLSELEKNLGYWEKIMQQASNAETHHQPPPTSHQSHVIIHVQSSSRNSVNHDVSATTTSSAKPDQNRI